MKIISKFKDYYDYLAGIYGEDALLVFDRRESNPAFAHLPHTTLRELEQAQLQTIGKFSFLSWTEYVLYVGNQRIYLFNTPKRVYSSKDIASIDYERRKMSDGFFYSFLVLHFFDGETFYIHDVSPFHNLWNTHEWLKLREVQEIDRRAGEIAPYADVPLLLSFSESSRSRKHCYVINPNLKALGIYLPEQWIWQEISTYLGRLRSEREISPAVPDIHKIENKGFDAKYSFRPKMKK